jgi:hypothetical protein
MALATLVPISGPKKVSISGLTPSNTPHYGLLPHPNPNVPPHINNRYINSYNVMADKGSWLCKDTREHKRRICKNLTLQMKSR